MAKQKTKEEPAEQIGPLKQIITDVMVNLNDAQAGIDLAIENARASQEGVRRFVKARKELNAIVKAIQPYAVN